MFICSRIHTFFALYKKNMGAELLERKIYKAPKFVLRKWFKKNLVLHIFDVYYLLRHYQLM